MYRLMTFAAIWRQVHHSSVSSNSLPKNVRPLAFVPLFHSCNVLVNSFTVFVTDFAEIFWKKFKFDYRKWIFRLILCPIALYEVKSSWPNPDSSRLSDFVRSPCKSS